MSNYDEFDDLRFTRGMQKTVGALGRRSTVQARGPLIGGMVVVLLLSLLVGVVFFSYPDSQKGDGAQAVPVIRAAAGPIKALPQDPGGMDIPYRDSTVFETLSAERKNAGQVENLLADTEEPLERSQIFAGLKTDLHVNDDNELSLTIAVPKKAAPEASTQLAAVEPASGTEGQADAPHDAFADPVVSSSTAPMPASKPAVKPAAAASSRTMADVVAAQVAPAAGVESATATLAGTHMIQLGSLRSDEAARAEWASLQQRFPGQLSNLALRVKTVDLGARGVFYRVQAGPVAEAQARALCSSMEAQRPNGCLVVKQ